jgi:hypothetical protein
MKSLSKKLVLMLLLFFSLTLLGVGFVGFCVAPVTVPARPEAAPEIVSVKINTNHRYSPPIYSTNPYTGETTLAYSGSYVPNGTIEITIKNRPFTPYIDKDGHTINRYYTFFVSPGGSGEPDRWWDYWLASGRPWYVVYQSDADYTVVSITYFPDLAPRPHIGVSYEGEVKAFRVQAVMGYFVHNGESDDRNAVYEGVGSEPAFFEIPIPVTNGTPKPTSTVVVPVTPKPSTSDFNDNPLPPQQQNPWSTYLLTVIVIVCIIVVPIVIVMYHNKRHQHKRKTINSSSNPSNTQFTRGF